MDLEKNDCCHHETPAEHLQCRERFGNGKRRRKDRDNRFHGACNNGAAGGGPLEPVEAKDVGNEDRDY